MKSYSKKLLSLLLALIMVIAILPAGQMAAWAATKAGKDTGASPQGTASLTTTAVTGITNTDAKISATLSPATIITTCGFYIGTSSGALTKQKTETVNGSISSMWYNLYTDWKPLTPGTKYYYQMYVTVNGSEILSNLASFVTTGQLTPLTLVGNPISNVTSTDAKISATLSALQYATTCGFYIGESVNSMVKGASESVNDNVTTIWYNLSADWHPLTPGATYYYKLYATVNGTEIQSGVMYFTTLITVANLPVESITETDARISATISPTVYVTSAGYYIGTSAAVLEKVSKPIYATISSIPFNVSEAWRALVPGTIYFYKIFITVNGIEHQSTVASFKTKGLNPVTIVTNSAAANITYTEATIAATLSQEVPTGTRFGYYIGTSLNTLSAVEKTSTSEISGMSFNLTNLTPGTVYYYKIYVIVKGVTFYSTPATFTTVITTIEILFNTKTVSDTHFYKVPWYRSYKKITMQLGFKTNDALYREVKWYSDNPKVVIDRDTGLITNLDTGKRTANITVNMRDSYSGAIKTDTVRLTFYKYSWQI